MDPQLRCGGGFSREAFDVYPQSLREEVIPCLSLIWEPLVQPASDSPLLGLPDKLERPRSLNANGAVLFFTLPPATSRIVSRATRCRACFGVHGGALSGGISEE